MEWLQNLYESFYNALIPEQRYLAYLSGLKMTLLISAFAVLLGIAIGTLVAVIKVSRKNSNNFLLKLGAVLCNIYTTVIRGTPAMLQVLLIYNIVFTSPNTNRVVVGAVCFGINSGAYVAEIIRAGIESVDRGQMEAARSLGLSYSSSMALVVIPQAVRTMIPSIINQFIITLKDTSILSIIGFPELTNVGKTIVGNTLKSLQTWAIVGVMYMVVIVTLSKVAKRIERRVNRGR